jgi:photosystem II stability/assembly factor-like uncharacterized protein
MSFLSRVQALLFSSASRLFLGLILGLFAASCTLLEETGTPSGPPGPGAEQGVVNLRLHLARNQNTLAKSASADTIFDLDSLTIILSANGAPTQTYTYPVTGRADLGNISVPTHSYVLSSLRVWKAKFISIDTTHNPSRRDTVHLDSVFFNVNAAETTYVAKTVSPAWSILRVRFVSTLPDSLTNSVKFLRLRVNGVVRDSLIIGGKNASLTWLQAISGGNIIHAAGDSGRVLKSTNDGYSWEEQTLTNQTILGGHFFDANKGSVISAGGKVFTTEDGGTSWNERNSVSEAIDVGGNGLPGDSINAANYATSSVLFAVGEGGGIYRSGNAGWGWHSLVSNTSQRLNGVDFVNSTTGYVVGENETILKTSNADASPGALPQNGGIIWAPVAGGWFPQTSGVENDQIELTRIQFTDANRGWAIGKNWRLLTTNAGATWSKRDEMDGPVNAFHFNTPTKGYAVGPAGALYQQDNNEWYWAPRSSGTTQDLHDVRIVGADTLYIVGANGTLMRSTNSSTTSWPYITLAQQTLPTLSSWAAPASGVTDSLRAVMFSGTTGWIVADGGKIFKSTNAGSSWTAQTFTKTRPLRALHAVSATVAVAVGDSGVTARTTNGGTNWTFVYAGVNTALRGTAFASASIGWAVGPSSVVRRTSNGGTSWANRTGGTGTFNAAAVSPARLWIVGDGGVIYRSSDLTYNATIASVANGGISAQNLYGVHFVSSNVGYIVGSSGLIAKVTDGNTGWVVQTSGTSQALRRIWFNAADTSEGYAVGDSGVFLKTTNGGSNWTSLTSSAGAAPKRLFGVHGKGDTVVAVGQAGFITRSSNAGSPFTNTTTLRSVWPVTSTVVYAAGDDGSIFKTTNAGTNWALQSSGTSQDLYGIRFRDASNGYAVGDGGTLLQTTDGGTNWIPRTSGTSLDLRSVTIASADTAYATGKNGIMIKTGNAGASWYVQETPSAVQLNHVYAYSKDLVFAVGLNGTILKAVNEGDNWTGGGQKKSLKGVHFPTVNTGYIVGAEGTILKTTNAGDFWTKQTSGVGGTLYGVYFTHPDTGWVTGDGGAILKTVNGGANWVAQASGSSITLRWTNFRNNQRGFAIGGTQSLVNTTNGGASWGGNFVGVPGTKLFDEVLTYKYLKPGQANTVLMEAIDDLSLPLRGFQATRTVTVGAGVDSTLSSPLTRCGYGLPTPDCVP